MAMDQKKGTLKSLSVKGSIQKLRSLHRWNTFWPVEPYVARHEIKIEGSEGYV